MIYKSTLLLFTVLLVSTPAYSAGVDIIILGTMFIVFLIATIIAIIVERKKLKEYSILSIITVIALLINLYYSVPYTVFIMELFGPISILIFLFIVPIPFGIINLLYTIYTRFNNKHESPNIQQ